MRILSLLSISALTLGLAASSSAAITYNIHFTFTDDLSRSGDLLFSATDAGSYYQATGITGTFNGEAVVTDSLSGYYGGNNQINKAPTWVTYGGVSFATVTSGDWNLAFDDANYFGQGPTYVITKDSGSTGFFTEPTVTVEAVPEPASMLAVSVGALALLRRRKR